jgi:hypothetical protein
MMPDGEEQRQRRLATLDAAEQRERMLVALERMADALERMAGKGRMETK